MKLELAEYKIKDVSWGDETCYKDNHLYINRKELKELLLEDDDIDMVKIDLAHPGEETRLVNVLDLLDARCKLGKKGTMYPGFLENRGIAGIGRTNVLTQFAIAEMGSVSLQTSSSRYGGILDMSGPGAEVTPYSKNHILCLEISANTKTVTSNALAFKRASMKTSKYLAESTINSKPDNLKKLKIDNNQNNDLPRIGHIYITECHNDLKESYFYGTNSRYFLPFVLHPNETKDGAMICMSYQYSPGHRAHTYSMMNNPIIDELYERNGEDLLFGGMIIANAHLEEELKKTNATVVSKLAKYNLNLDGVIITKEGGGHPVTDLMLCSEKCEQLDIKTALITEEVLSEDGTGLPVVWHSEYADLVISSGAHEEPINIPEMSKLIGSEDETKKQEMRIRLGEIPNALNILGHTKSGALEF